MRRREFLTTIAGGGTRAKRNVGAWRPSPGLSKHFDQFSRLVIRPGWCGVQYEG